VVVDNSTMTLLIVRFLKLNLHQTLCLNVKKVLLVYIKLVNAFGFVHNFCVSSLFNCI
jgi:hypothetical protein